MAKMDYGALVGAIDQGTSSSRFLVFSSKTSELINYHQIEVEQKFPKKGWVEQDPNEFVTATLECIEKVCSNLKQLNVDASKLVAVGITNQRETTVVWDKSTGEPLYNAVVWLDTRTTSTVDEMLRKVPDSGGRDKKYHFQKLCGLPISTYFSALKLRWLMDNVPAVSAAVKDGRALFGTVDTWLLWKLTGGVDGGIHVTDVTNASRTMLMNINTLQWDQQLCSFFDIPMDILPKICSSSEVYGRLVTGALKGLPISGILGDQQSALVGQSCFKRGEVKNTYGTGCFMLYHTGQQVVLSTHGLLTTVAYQLGPRAPPCYALEGSVAIGGAVVRWLRDNLGLIARSEDIEPLANSVDDCGDCYFVPAFSGLYAPHWHTNARGIICGLTQYTTKAHIARAALEAVCFQSKEVLDAMEQDSGIAVPVLRVDGGMTVNSSLMQMQADISGTPVERPSMTETTALGAAMAAGAAAGIDVWDLSCPLAGGSGEATGPAVVMDRFTPHMQPDDRRRAYGKWKAAVERSRDWLTTDTTDEVERRSINSLSLGLFLFATFGLWVLGNVTSAAQTS